MSDEQADTGEITARFRSFASRTDDEPGRRRTGEQRAMLLALAAVAVVVIGAIAWFALR
jgi:hypothetical protein